MQQLLGAYQSQLYGQVAQGSQCLKTSCAPILFGSMWCYADRSPHDIKVPQERVKIRLLHRHLIGSHVAQMSCAVCMKSTHQTNHTSLFKILIVNNSLQGPFFKFLKMYRSFYTLTLALQSCQSSVRTCNLFQWAINSSSAVTQIGGYIAYNKEKHCLVKHIKLYIIYDNMHTVMCTGTKLIRSTISESLTLCVRLTQTYRLDSIVNKDSLGQTLERWGNPGIYESFLSSLMHSQYVILYTVGIQLFSDFISKLTRRQILKMKVLKRFFTVIFQSQPFLNEPSFSQLFVMENLFHHK